MGRNGPQHETVGPAQTRPGLLAWPKHDTVHGLGRHGPTRRAVLGSAPQRSGLARLARPATKEARAHGGDVRWATRAYRYVGLILSRPAEHGPFSLSGWPARAHLATSMIYHNCNIVL